MIVIDSSALLAILFNEPEKQASASLFRYASGDAPDQIAAQELLR